MNILAIIKNIGVEEYTKLLRLENEELKKNISAFFASDYFGKLSKFQKQEVINAVYRLGEDEIKIFLYHLSKLLNSNINSDVFKNYYIQLLLMHPTLDIAELYTLLQDSYKKENDLCNAIDNIVNNVSMKSYEEAKMSGSFMGDALNIYATPAFNALDGNIQDKFYQEIKKTVVSKIPSWEKDYILERYLEYFQMLHDIDASLVDTILNIMLDYPDFEIMYVYDKLKDVNYSNDDIKRYLKICAKFYENVVSIITNIDLKKQGVVDIILNGFINTDLDAEHLEYAVSNILFYQKIEDAIPAIMALFILPSNEHLSFVEKLLGQKGIQYNPHLASFIRYVSLMNEEDLPLVEYEAKYEEGYYEMPFGKAAMEYNKVAMDYLDNHPGCKSTTLVRVPYRKERSKYKI